MLVHIPKCSGISFYIDARKLVPRRVRVEQNMEKPLVSTPRKLRTFLISFLRHPVKHVVSQFLMCKYHKETRQPRCNFPRGSRTLDGFSQWLSTFTSPKPGAKSPFCMRRGDRWSLGFDMADMVFDYNCYNPWNMQARYMATRMGHHVAIDQIEPDITLAKLGLQNLTFAAITDLYPESVCAFRFYITGELPPDCECVQATSNSTNLTHNKHGLPEYNVSDLSPEQFRNVSKLVQVDVRVFLHALVLFERSVDDISKLTGKRIICNDRLTELKTQALQLCQAVSAEPLLCALL